MALLYWLILRFNLFSLGSLEIEACRSRFFRLVDIYLAEILSWLKVQRTLEL